MILGISGSGRANGTTSDVVNYILEESGQEYEYVSLAGKKINFRRSYKLNHYY